MDSPSILKSLVLAIFVYFHIRLLTYYKNAPFVVNPQIVQYNIILFVSLLNIRSGVTYTVFIFPFKVNYRKYSILSRHFLDKNRGEKLGGWACERVIGDFCMDIEYQYCYCKPSRSLSTCYRIQLFYPKL